MTEHQPLGALASNSRASDPLHGTPYRALGSLGVGAMSEILDAEHRALKKPVVVKLLRDELAGDFRFVDRLRVEAQALAAISHPNVVNVTDLGQTPSGRPYLVMERLYGRTLREELTARGALPPAAAIGVVRQILAGLAAAHRTGVVHRDVKLDNVIICEPLGREEPVVKLLDFSIVKVLADTGAQSVAAPLCPTEEGMLVGTPRFVAPEQVKFQKVDARTDVYAAGLILYTLVAGRGPFADIDDPLLLLNAHVSQQPEPPSRHAPQPLPPELDQAILKALAKNPEERFQTAELFSLELARVSTSLMCTTEPLQPRSVVEGSVRDAGRHGFPAGGSAHEGATLPSRPVEMAEGGRPVVPPHAGAAGALPATGHAGSTHEDVSSSRRMLTLAGLTLGSAVLFSVVIALLFRYLGIL